ncbi:hypothetical protein Efla_000449 [Eimeria flavescens]
MGRRYSLHVGLAALSVSTCFFKPSEGFKTQRPGDIALNVEFEHPGSLVETKWGSKYFPVPGGTVAEDGSIDFYFVNAVEGVPSAQDNLAAHLGCEAMNKGLSDISSARLMTLTEISDVRECAEACSKTLNCRAAQYTVSTSKCVLLKGMAGTMVEQADSAVVLPNCESDCFHPGYKLAGNSTSLGNAPSANFCQAMCASNSGCHGFTFVKSTRECLSFPSDSDLEEDADAISGSRASCAPHLEATEYTGSCTIAEMTGAALQELESFYNVETYEQCQKLCLNNPKCNFLTHNKPDRRCYLKPGMGKIEFKKKGDTTGPRLCDGTCFLKDIELTGALDSVVEKCVSAHFCHYECSMKKECDMWSYDEEKKKCSLFSKAEELTGRRASGVWTGPKVPCAKEALYTLPASPCALRGVRFGNGEPLAVSTQETPEKCQNACQLFASCQAYTYDVQEKKCELFLASAERNKEENVNFISGPRLCSDTCLLQNWDYVGKVVEQLTSGISTPEECQLRCQATTNCSYWSFQATKNLCKLLSNEFRKAVTGAVGGPKYCQGSCDIRGYSLGAFGWMEHLKLPNAEACRAECNAKEKCAMYVNSDKCYLFDEYALVHLKTEPIALTGFKTCSNCFRQGVGYRADSSALLWGTQTLNAEECRRRCSYMERCTRFSYNAKTTACDLLSGEGEDVEGTNLISGPAQCSRSTSCYQKDGTYGGGEAIVKKTQTPQQCQELCEKTPSCKVFSHNSRDTTCNLLSGDNLTLQSSAGWVSGNKKCITLGDQLCSEDGKDYSGLDQIPKAVICNDQLCCRNACLNNPKCKTWMWNIPTKHCWLKALEAYTKSYDYARTFSAGRTGCPYCARWGESYSGPVAATKTTATQGQCQLECQLLKDCKAWTFGPGTSCKLYSNPGIGLCRT